MDIEIDSSKSMRSVNHIKTLAIRGNMWLFFRYVVSGIVGILGTFYVGREVGPEIWGMFSISYVISTLLREASVKIFASLIRSPFNLYKRYVADAWSLSMVLAIVVLGLGGIPLLLVGELPSKYVLWLVLCGFVSGAIYFVHSIPRAILERNMVYNLLSIIEFADTATLYLGAAALLASLDDKIIALSVSILLRAIVSCILSISLIKLPVKFAWSLRNWGTILRGGSLYMCSDIVNWLNGLAPLVIVGGLLGASALGIAQMAFRLLAYIQGVILMMNRILFPLLARLQEAGAEVRSTISRTLHIYLLALVFVYIPLIGLSPSWVPRLLGESWRGVANMLAILGPGLIWWLLAYAIITSLYSVGFDSSALGAQIGYSAVYWALGWMMTIHYGMAGISIAYGTASFALLVVMNLVWKTRTESEGFMRELCFSVFFIIIVTMLWLTLAGRI